MARTVLLAEVAGFYAAVERADDPELARRPVIVGGDPRKRGVVVAATPDALKAGVALEMPVVEALGLCPRARAVRTHLPRYREVSRRLIACLRRAFPRLEPFGLGGAYFDVSIAPEPPEAIAERLRALVREELSLPLRVGIASGRFLARLAAEEAGVDGVHRVPAGEEQAFLWPLPATRLEGVGRKTAAALAALGAHTIGDVASLGRERLQEELGTHGLRIHAYATGSDERPVRASRHAQSLSREATVRPESTDLPLLEERLLDLARTLEGELALQGLSAGKVGLKVRYGDGATESRSRTLGLPTAAAGAMHGEAVDLLARTHAGSRPVRALGIQLGGLAPSTEVDRQLDLFGARSPSDS